MKDQLVTLLREHEYEISDAWRHRLSENAVLAGRRVTDGFTNPVRPLLTDFVRVLEGKLPTAQKAPETELLDRLGPSCSFRISLGECVDAFLTGEVVIRRSARAHLDATDSEFLELYELLSRTTHQLVRYYTLRFCESCRARMKEETIQSTWQ